MKREFYIAVSSFTMIYTVIGARRGTGLEVVRRLTEKLNSEVTEIRAVLRVLDNAPEELRAPADTRVKLVIANASSSESLSASGCLIGSRCVFFCASAATVKNYKEVDELGVKVVAEAALACSVPKVVLVSSQLVHPRNKWHCMRLLLNNVFTNGIMDFKFAGEQHLRKSGVQSYVIIRPGQLIDGPLHYGSVCVGQTNEHFMSGMATTRADVADVCVAAATCDRCNNVTFECASTPAPGCSATPINADQLLGELSAEWDRVTFL